MKRILKRGICAICIVSLSAVSLTAASAQTLVPGESTSISLQGIYEPLEEGETVYSISIVWEDMEYTYSEGARGSWNPETHTYNNSVASGWDWEDESNKITIMNHSNAAVDAVLLGATNGNVTGGFYTETKGGEELEGNTVHLDSAVGTAVENPPTEEVYYQITGGEIQDSGAIGSITITLQGAGETGGKDQEEPTTPAGELVTQLTLMTSGGNQEFPLYTTDTPNVYRTDVIDEMILMDGMLPVTIDETEYYVGGTILDAYSTVSLSTVGSSMNYIQMQANQSFYLEINLEEMTISTVKS